MSSSGYVPWSVTAGEVPTTAYWNLLGSNDASFNTGNGFNDGIIINRHMANSSVTGNNLSLGFAKFYGNLSSNWTTTSAVANVPGINCSITTNGGAIYIYTAATFSTSTQTGSMGVSVNGTNYVTMQTNLAGETVMSGATFVTGLAAGTYVIQMFAANQTAGNTFTVYPWNNLTIAAMEF